MTATVKTRKKAAGRPAKLKLNPAVYGRLLAEALPAVITSEAEYDRVAALLDKLVVISDKQLTPEQERLLDLLTLLIEKYDDEHYRIPDAAPYEIIQHLMKERGLRNKDLEPALGSRGVTSDVVNGKRPLSKAQIKNLANLLNLPPEVLVSFA